MADLTNPEVLRDIFKHHPPKDEAQIQQYQRIRDAAHEFAKVIVANTPKCADQSAAIRHVRDATMTANAAIALEGKV